MVSSRATPQHGWGLRRRDVDPEVGTRKTPGEPYATIEVRKRKFLAFLRFHLRMKLDLANALWFNVDRSQAALRYQTVRPARLVEAQSIEI